MQLSPKTLCSNCISFRPPASALRRAHAAWRRWAILVIFLTLPMSGCDSGGGGEEDTRLDPDDITVRITQNTGTQRDQIKTSVTSQADEELDYIDVSLAFFDDEGAQIGQMPFVFAGRYQTGQSAEMELSLPASIMRHSAYACYRYSVGMSTSDGDFGEKDYDGTCDD